MKSEIGKIIEILEQGFRMGAQALEAEPSIAVPRRCKRCGERFMGTPKETMCADCADDDLRTGDWHKPGSKVEAAWPFEVDHAGDPEPQGGEDVTCRDCGRSGPEAEYHNLGGRPHCPECGSANTVPTEEL